MVFTFAKRGWLAAALLVTFATVAACSTSGESSPGTSTSSALSSEPTARAGKTDAAPKVEAPAAGSESTGDAVVFEVTGTGSATTIDLVPGDDRLYNVPLPWSTTVTVTPDVTQLQVVVVGSGDANPGCKITLNGRVVAEEPEGGDAQCVFDR